MGPKATPKSTRKHLTLEEKKEIIRLRDEGQGGRAIGRLLGVPESTVRKIYSQREDILKSVRAYGSSVFDSRSKANAVLVKMERYLDVWISRKETECVPLDRRQIMDQMFFYNAICERENVPPGKFSASQDWLYRFLRHKNIRHIKLTGEYQELVFRQLRDATESNVELRMIQEGNMDDGSEEDDDELPELPLPDADMPDMSARTKTVAQFWKSFTVKDAIDNLMVAWKGLSVATVQHGWKKLTPHLYSQDEPLPPDLCYDYGRCSCRRSRGSWVQ